MKITDLQIGDIIYSRERRCPCKVLQLLSDAEGDNITAACSTEMNIYDVEDYVIGNSDDFTPINLIHSDLYKNGWYLTTKSSHPYFANDEVPCFVLNMNEKEQLFMHTIKVEFVHQLQHLLRIENDNLADNFQLDSTDLYDVDNEEN